jgi:hypothetical protein
MNKLIMCLILVVSSMNLALAEENSDYRGNIDVIFFGDDFSEAYRINASIGKENSAGYLISGGVSSLHATDGEGAEDNGIFIDVSKYFSESARLRSRLYYYQDLGLLGQVTLYGKLSQTWNYYSQCQREIVDNSIGINDEIYYHGCDISIEKQIQDFGVVLGRHEFDFSDSNSKDGWYGKLYYQLNDNIRVSLNDKRIDFGFNTTSYFSPREWNQKYAMINFYSNGTDSAFSNNIGIGYGEEEINQYKRNPTYIEYNAYYDTDTISLFAKVNSRFSSDYKSIWVSIGLMKKF